MFGTHRNLQAALFIVVIALLTMLAPVLAQTSDMMDKGIVHSIVKAPIVTDGTVTGSATDFVITLDTSLDPSEPGRTLLEGKSIRITLPEDFTLSGDLPFVSVGGAEDCVPGNLQCNTGVLLQGWPQHPIGPPAQKYSFTYEEATNTIVYTALQDLIPNSPDAPGIKQLHLILSSFTNPSPGTYAVQVEAETGMDGAVETGTGLVHILSDIRPSINNTSVFNEGTPNALYQQTEIGNVAPLSFDFLLWDSAGNPLDNVTIMNASSTQSLLVQGDLVVGQIIVDAPDGAQDFAVFAAAPSTPVNAPVTGIPTAHLRVGFRAGTVAGDYTITFALNDGNVVTRYVHAS